ncbi:hypothetical protein MRB53_001308 [Persea americana]|uniref:Uncharacterized protein n=1 Tax=Persea americana TaxID=3435 RepID=A0ACC2MRM5_PERAE|nr:hypothetical protein MRB53_001308 [Persea americana]
MVKYKHPSPIETSRMAEAADMQYVDDFYFSALSNDEEPFPISDDKYAEELQLQEVLMSSIQPPQFSKNLTKKLKRVKTEVGESSQNTCDICVEEKSMDEMFRNNNCRHLFCSDCISRHVAAKIQENITMVRCPQVGCKGVLEPQICRPILPKDVFERWENAICEWIVLGSKRIYCPFKDCSALLVDDGGVDVRESECPNCRRLFCAQCMVPWHSGVGCREYQKLGVDERGKDDLSLMELAKSQKWKRCPRCKYYVEKTEGCLHITCRLVGVGFNFAMDADQRGVILTRAADPAEEIVNIHGGWSSQINLQTFDFE